MGLDLSGNNSRETTYDEGDRNMAVGYTHTHTHPFNGALSGTTQVGHYQKSKTNLDFTDATNSEWQWHQLGHMQVCTSLQADNHASIPLLCTTDTGNNKPETDRYVQQFTVTADLCSNGHLLAEPGLAIPPLVFFLWQLQQRTSGGKWHRLMPFWWPVAAAKGT